MKRFSVLAASILLLLTLTGCFEKDFESDALVLRGAKTLDFSAGETKTVTAELPQLEGIRLTAISPDPALDAEISDARTLTLHCDTPGSYILTLRLEAKGYRTKEKRYPVEVTPQPMRITAAIEGGDPFELAEGLTLGMGEEAVLVLSGAPANAMYNIENTEASVLDAAHQANGIRLAALAPGEAALQIEITHAGYEPFSATLPVTVLPQPTALLELSAQSVTGSTQETLRVTCPAFQNGGRLLAAADDPAVSATVDGNIIRIASTKEGRFEVTVSCEAEGHQTAVQTVQATFTAPPAPPVPMRLPASVTVALGQTTAVEIADLPEGAALALSGGNRNIAFENRDGVLLIEGKAIGSASITATASCAGYTDSRATISVTVGGVSYSASSRYSSYAKEIIALVNETRAGHDLPALTYLPELDGACQVRARESSELWDHNRPDGRGWQTVLTDMGYAYYAAGENLLAANVLDAAKAVEAWMDSPGHRDNLLRKDFTGICVGIVQDGDGDYYYAQIFITKGTTS